MQEIGKDAGQSCQKGAPMNPGDMMRVRRLCAQLDLTQAHVQSANQLYLQAIELMQEAEALCHRSRPRGGSVPDQEYQTAKEVSTADR